MSQWSVWFFDVSQMWTCHWQCCALLQRSCESNCSRCTVLQTLHNWAITSVAAVPPVVMDVRSWELITTWHPHWGCKLNMHETDLLRYKVEEMCVCLKVVHTFLDIHEKRSHWLLTTALIGSHFKTFHFLPMRQEIFGNYLQFQLLRNVLSRGEPWG